jgi:hypothetical protein
MGEMKFFTLDAYRAWYRELDDAPQKAAYQAYRRHLEAMREVLPADVVALGELQGIDDGLIVEAHHDRSQQLFTLVLRCGDLQLGYYDLVLTYRDAEISPEHERRLAEVARTGQDAYYHEVDRAEDGRIEHRWLFHPGLEIDFRCRELQWSRVERPDRELPPLDDRFPAGC